MSLKDDINFQRVESSESNIENICEEYYENVILFITASVDTHDVTGTYYCVVYYKGNVIKLTNKVKTLSFDRVHLEAIYDAVQHIKSGYNIVVVTGTDIALHNKLELGKQNDDIVISIVNTLKAAKASLWEYYLNRAADKLNSFVRGYFGDTGNNLTFSSSDNTKKEASSIDIQRDESPSTPAPSKSGKSFCNVLFALNDKVADITYHPNSGILRLIADVLNKSDHFVTYGIEVNNLDSVLNEAIEEALITLTEREQDIIRKRYGLYDGKGMTLEEIGKIYGVTRERIRQIELKALRKLRHSSRRYIFDDFVYIDKQQDKSQVNSHCKIDYSQEIETIIKKEINYIIRNKVVDITSFLSKNIICSPQFSENFSISYGNNTRIEELELSTRAYNCLKKTPYTSVGVLMHLSYDDYMRIPHLGSKSADEVLNAIKGYDEDTGCIVCTIKTSRNLGSLFNTNRELITRTSLAVNEMILLLQKGFLYVSDFVDTYEKTDDKELDSIYNSLVKKKTNLLDIQYRHDHPLLWVKLDPSLVKQFKKMNIRSFQDLENNLDAFSRYFCDEVNQIYSLVSDIYKKFN